MPVFMIERRFAEQLEPDADEIRGINEINADEDVRWLHIYVYEVATPAGARTLRDGFAKQNSLESAFDTGLEGVLTGLDHADPATSDGATTPATDTAQVIGATGRYAYDIIVAATDGSTDVQAVATSLARAQDALLASAG